jgi:Phage portal protein
MAGNRIFNLGTTARMLTDRAQQAIYSSSDKTPSIASIPASAWPNPLQPVKPFGPPGSKPLGFPFFEGQNLNFTARPDAEYTSSELRQLATYPLARICIENVKDIVCQTPWTMGLKPIPGETQKERAKRQKGDENIVNLSRFFEYPDGTTDWPSWSRGLVENLLTIDAASILVERSGRGKVAALRGIDGATITRYIDERGLTPTPPGKAYTQTWYGQPRVDFTTDELLYGVRNIVPRDSISSYLYGLSATEAVAPEIKIGIERLNFIAAYYTSGATPDVIQIAPPGINPDQVKEAMVANNAVLSGNLARRRQWTILQGFQKDGKPDQILFPKEPLLSDPFDDVHIRKIAYAYGDSPARLQKMMNRSSAESSQTSSEEEGITPWVIWLQSVINRIIQQYMMMPDYEITFKQERESDIKKLMETDVGYVKNGGYSWNERRELRGDDPRPEPQADELGIITANGWLQLGSMYQPSPSATPGGDSAPASSSSDKVIRLVERGA